MLLWGDAQLLLKVLYRHNRIVEVFLPLWLDYGAEGAARRRFARAHLRSAYFLRLAEITGERTLMVFCNQVCLPTPHDHRILPLPLTTTRPLILLHGCSLLYFVTVFGEGTAGVAVAGDGGVGGDWDAWDELEDVLGLGEGSFGWRVLVSLFMWVRQWRRRLTHLHLRNRMLLLPLKQTFRRRVCLQSQPSHFRRSLRPGQFQRLLTRILFHNHVILRSI